MVSKCKKEMKEITDYNRGLVLHNNKLSCKNIRELLILILQNKKTFSLPFYA